jgi:hypothetical protein
MINANIFMNDGFTNAINASSDALFIARNLVSEKTYNILYCAYYAACNSCCTTSKCICNVASCALDSLLTANKIELIPQELINASLAIASELNSAKNDANIAYSTMDNANYEVAIAMSITRDYSIINEAILKFNRAVITVNIANEKCVKFIINIIFMQGSSLLKKEKMLFCPQN